MTAFLEIDLALRQGTFALAVEARVGRAAAVLGPSGAGKTTLLEAIAGLRRAGGRLAIGGDVLQDSATGTFLPPERRRLGYVPQQGALFPHLSVLANLTFGRPGRRAGGEDLDALVAGLELLPLLARYPRHLSGGEQRRVALARALLARPRLLLLDEPTAGLDPLRARKALAGIRRVSAELGVPLLVVTHDDREALALAAEVVLLEGGQVRQVGPARAVLLAARTREPAGERPWDNVVPARLLRHCPEGGTSEVVLSSPPSAGAEAGGAGGEVVTIPHTPDLAPGADLLLSIAAEDLLIATVRPSGLSARNAVAGRIDEIIPLGSSVYARVGPWLAHLTLAAVAELGLTPGTPAWLVAKTHSWRVLSG